VTKSNLADWANNLELESATEALAADLDSSPAPTADHRGRRAQTPSRPASTRSLPLARTPEGRAFTAASTAACSRRSGEPSPNKSNARPLSIFKPMVFGRFYAAAN
jgi:hypothetical protein